MRAVSKYGHTVDSSLVGPRGACLFSISTRTEVVTNSFSLPGLLRTTPLLLIWPVWFASLGPLTHGFLRCYLYMEPGQGCQAAGRAWGDLGS